MDFRVRLNAVVERSSMPKYKLVSPDARKKFL